MDSCCRGGPCEEMFGPEAARDDMEEYLEDGLGPLEAEMVGALPANVPLAGARVLEVGGGVGAIVTELLKRGAATGEVIEVVGAYAPFAERLARESGVVDRTRFRVHDLLDDPDAVEPADVVVMNRVVCCSADGPQLTAAAARLARGALLMSFPRANLLSRALAAGLRLFNRVVGRRYRAYVWAEEALIAAAGSAGLTPVATGGNWAWRYRVLART